ncbi:MAG: ribonuclease Z [Proteobacteria bacterium]|nr:ribonuclease Z [Pseudomonadota bacterium]
MKPLFHTQLIHDPFGDPGMYVDFMFDRRALLFDMGDLQPLSPRKILKISHIFVSHTHMDHFIGFDHLLRIFLGRDKELSLFGPPSFIDHVGNKLASYTWNLVENYSNNLTLRVTEVNCTARKTACFRVQSGFRREDVTRADSSGSILLDEAAFRVRTMVLDHKIPCLAFCVEEKQHVNILKTSLEKMGLAVGPWLKGLKEAVIRKESDETLFRVCWKEKGKTREREIPLGELKASIVKVVAGQKITYVADVIYHEENERKIVELAKGSDMLFIETGFLQRDARLAAEKFHLTAQQAGHLAHLSRVKQLVPFHFSPKYTHQGDLLIEEAMKTFRNSP